MSISQSPVMWRFQTGPLLHLGLTRNGLLRYQKSSITGSGKLTAVQLHLIANLTSGRIIAEASLPDKSDVAAFFIRALRNAEAIGGPPQTVVFSRQAARDHPQLLQASANAGANPVFATQSFKLRQKISRHFEDYLHEQIVGHSGLAKWDNFQSCFPRLVEAWNVDGQIPMEQRPSRYAVGSRTVEAQLGLDPRDVAEREFQRRRIELLQLEIQRGNDPGFHFRDAYGIVGTYCGFDLRFTTASGSYQVPLFAAPSSWQNTRTLRNFDPHLITFRKADVPVELRCAWRIDDQQFNHALSMRDMIWAMVARQVPPAEIAVLLRKLIRAWGVESPLRGCRRFSENSETQPSAPIQEAGVKYANESWERIRERHFWRAYALWDAGCTEPIPFARVQVESDGRIDALPIHPLDSDTSASFNELLRSTFFRGTNLPLSEGRRQEIVARLRENIAARSRER